MYLERIKNRFPQNTQLKLQIAGKKEMKIKIRVKNKDKKQKITTNIVYINLDQ